MPNLTEYSMHPYSLKVADGAKNKDAKFNLKNDDLVEVSSPKIKKAHKS